MKKLKLILITSAIICTCILCLGGCGNSDNNGYSLKCNFLCDNTPVDDVIVCVNGVESGIVSKNGEANLTNLNKGDKITFIKEGYIIDKVIFVSSDSKVTINVKRAGFEKVLVKSNVKNLEYNVTDNTDGKFSISFVMPENMVFNGYYKGEILLSKDKDYVFDISLRGEIFVKIDKLFKVDIVDFDTNKMIDSSKYTLNSKIKLIDYVNLDKVFVSYYEKDKLLSNDINYEYIVKEDSKILIKLTDAKIDYTIKGRELTSSSNVSFDIYINDKKIKENVSDSNINLAKIIMKSGEYKVSLINDKYNLNKSFNITISNDKNINYNIVKNEDKYYLITSDNMEGYKVDICANNSHLTNSLEVKDSVYYVDVTSVIIDGKNTIEVSTIDSDNITSNSSKITEYVNYTSLVEPTFNIAEQTLYVTNNDDYVLYLVINGVKVGKILGDSVKLNLTGKSTVGVIFTKENYISSYSEKIVELDTYNDINIDTTNCKKMFISSENNVITLSRHCNYYLLKINGVLLSNKFNSSVIDLSEFICKTGIYNITAYGYINNQLFCYGEGSFDLAKNVDINENFLLTKLGNKYVVFLDKNYNATYYVDDVVVSGNYLVIDKASSVVKVSFSDGFTFVKQLVI